MKTTDIVKDAFRTYFEPIVTVWKFIEERKVYAYIAMVAVFHVIFLIFGCFVMWDWTYIAIAEWHPKARVFFVVPWALGFIFGDLLAGHLNSLERLRIR